MTSVCRPIRKGISQKPVAKMKSKSVTSAAAEKTGPEEFRIFFKDLIEQ